MKPIISNNIIVVIPARNEAVLVADTVEGIIKTTKLPVLVVDDASMDETAAKARQSGAQVMTLASQLGAWGATQAGLRYALKHHYGIAITFDADGQHDANEIASLLTCLEEHDADVAIGACPQRGSLARKIAWHLFRTLSGLTISHLTSGFRAYSKPSIQLLSNRNATSLDYQDIGVLCMLRQAGMKIDEVDVCMYPRINGKSRIFDSWFAVAKYMFYSSILALCHSKFTRSK